MNTQNKNSNLQNTTEKRNKKNSFLFGLSAVLVSILIIVLIFGGVFYFIISKNINGFAERYREQISTIPVLKNALPEVEDPEDPKYMSDEQVRKKYQELRKLRDELKDQLAEAQKRIDEMQNQIAERDKKISEYQALEEELKNKIAEADKELQELEEAKYKFQQEVANKDSSGFIEFYKGMDKSNAEKLYIEILKDKKIDDEVKNFVKIYENMEPKSAAKIFEQMGDSKLNLVVDIMKNMKRDVCAQVLAAMNPEYASKVSEELSKLYIAAKEENETADSE
ncbi:MAG TPA: hypothetical protein GXX36_05645 [Clostridiaceae bacterium]|nr:hypothetical protein [Clostridiaceae bacterium]HHV99042.1 hypothetical protein [Clostridiaceae bacterium]